MFTEIIGPLKYGLNGLIWIIIVFDTDDKVIKVLDAYTDQEAVDIANNVIETLSKNKE